MTNLLKQEVMIYFNDILERSAFTCHEHTRRSLKQFIFTQQVYNVHFIRKPKTTSTENGNAVIFKSLNIGIIARECLVYIVCKY